MKNQKKVEKKKGLNKEKGARDTKRYSENSFIDLIMVNYKQLFKDRIVETGFKKAFKGNWGAEAHTKRLGV